MLYSKTLLILYMVRYCGVPGIFKLKKIHFRECVSMPSGQGGDYFLSFLWKDALRALCSPTVNSRLWYRHIVFCHRNVLILTSERKKCGKKESEVTQSCATLCNPVDCSPPGSSVYGIIQARILAWVAIFFSTGIFPTQGSNSGLLHCRQTL